VSTDRQAKEGHSLEEQESELKKFCDYRNFHIHHTYIERGKSGGNTNRPEYQKLVADIESKKINAIVVKKLDRLSRSLLDFEHLITRLQVNAVEFISLRENFDTTTAMGKAMLRIALVFAQLEREQTAERISDVMQYRASIGLHNGGKPPVGYTCVNKEWVVYQKEKECVELIFKRFLEVKSTLQVATMLNDMGISRRVKAWDCRRVQEILQNPSYLGHRKWKTQLFHNTHPPIIAEKHFQDVQLIFQKRPKFSALNAPFQKLLVCGFCQSIMTPSYSLNDVKIRFYYYRCSRQNKTGFTIPKPCTIKQISFTQLTQRVLAAFRYFSSETGLSQLESKVLANNQNIQTEQANIQSNLTQLAVQKGHLKTQEEKYLDSLITGQFSGKERARINAKLDELSLALKQLEKQQQHLDFSLTQHDAERLNLGQIKHILLAFIETEPGSPDFKVHLHRHIGTIFVTKLSLTLSVYFLPWGLDFSG